LIDNDRPTLLPIACGLDLVGGRERVRQWQELAPYHIGTTREPDAVVVRFRDYPGVYDQLRRLAAAERDCCPFLVFDVTRADCPVVVRITAAPESDVDVASVLDRLVPVPTTTTK
jgi:hypothetical protein